jgi:hypothetical protein
LIFQWVATSLIINRKRKPCINRGHIGLCYHEIAQSCGMTACVEIRVYWDTRKVKIILMKKGLRKD